jgi:hypothetical protein
MQRPSCVCQVLTVPCSSLRFFCRRGYPGPACRSDDGSDRFIQRRTLGPAPRSPLARPGGIISWRRAARPALTGG